MPLALSVCLRLVLIHVSKIFIALKFLQTKRKVSRDRYFLLQLIWAGDLHGSWHGMVPKKVPLDVNNGNVLNDLFAFVNYEQCSSLHNTFNHSSHSPCYRTPLWYFPWNLHWDAGQVQLVFVVNGTMQFYYLLNKTATWHAN